MQKFVVPLVLGAVLVAVPAAAGLFDAPGGNSDLANSWLDHVFKGSGFTVNVPGITSFGDPGGSTSTTMGGTLPMMFKKLATMYSTAMLLLAALILAYHLFAMVVHTAHDGRVMGKGANQIWTPVRVVFALGLLVPVADGFSGGQWLVASVARMGSGLASYVWGSGGIGRDLVTSGSRVSFKADASPEAVVNELFAVGYCAKDKQMAEASNNAYYLGAANPPTYPAGLNATAAEAQDVFNALAFPPFPGDSPLSHPAATQLQASGKAILIGGDKVDGRAGFQSYNYYAASALPGGGGYDVFVFGKPCGTVIQPALGDGYDLSSSTDHAAIAALQDAHRKAFNQIEGAALQLGASYAAAQRRREGHTGITVPMYAGGGGGFSLVPFNSNSVAASKASIVQAYRDAYKAALAGVPGLTFCEQGSARGVGTACTGVPNEQIAYIPRVLSASDAGRMAGNSGLGMNDDLGWMSAGAYFISLTTQSSALKEASKMRPQVAAMSGCGDVAGCRDTAAEALNVQEEFEAERSSVRNGWERCNSGADLMACGRNVAKKALTTTGLVNDKGQFIWLTQFTSPHPLADMIGLGSRLVDGAVNMFIVGLTAVSISGVLGFVDKLVGGNSSVTAAAAKLNPAYRFLTGFVGPAAWFVALLCFGLALLLFLPGVLLFYVLPLLGFYNFFTGIITWFISLLQAVAAIPVIAIAHLSPNGEGLPSAMARPAYLLLLQVVLRPVMMLFGLIVACIVINTGIGLLNTLFFGVYKLQLVGGEPGLLGNIIYFVLYAAACFGIVNAAITAIDSFPMKAMAWVGGGTVDDNHDVRGLAAYGMMSAAQGAMSRTVGGAQSASAALVGRGKEMIERGEAQAGARALLADTAKQKSDEAAAKTADVAERKRTAAISGTSLTGAEKPKSEDERADAANKQQFPKGKS